MKTVKKIARYLAKYDVDVDTCDMNVICAKFGVKYEDIRALLAEEYDVAMTEFGMC